MVIPMLKIRRPLGRLIFNMGIAIPSKTIFLIETAPWFLVSPGHQDKMVLSVQDERVIVFHMEGFQLRVPS